jgi:hypothetical protein
MALACGNSANDQPQNEDQRSDVMHRTCQFIAAEALSRRRRVPHSPQCEPFDACLKEAEVPAIPNRRGARYDVTKARPHNGAVT